MFKKISAYLIGLIFFFPIFFLISSAIKPTKDIFAIPPKILFFSIDLKNFQNAFSQIDFFPSILDSFIIAHLLEMLSYNDTLILINYLFFLPLVFYIYPKTV